MEREQPKRTGHEKRQINNKGNACKIYGNI